MKTVARTFQLEFVSLLGLPEIQNKNIQISMKVKDYSHQQQFFSELLSPG